MFDCQNVIKTRYYLVVLGLLIHQNCRINLVNVYAPNDEVLRRQLWSNLLQVRNSIQGLWVFMGDFNEVREPSERQNSEFMASQAECFNQFILSAALQEYKMGGGRFTYISDNGTKLSKLDCFLVCLGYMEIWPNASVLALDHRPIILNTTPADFGHIPFRFYNSWFEFCGFLEYVKQLCMSFTFSGPSDLALAVKLRWLKNKIKEWVTWYKNRLGGVYSEKKKIVAHLEHLAESRPHQQEELSSGTDCMQFILEADRLKQLDARQKSRSWWALEGDENSSFFHSIVDSNLSM
ncbi:uncharacterized protein LOC118484743 [Helianthus annuus]|uniref:uncharacterized protein LOC118484743 n=1 Tax=Helianthus annuus TaxID=4232 RepID=UPI0016531CAE|nr:uncharacterized protein LOC118484743 [Helianthus annuus]